MTFPHNTGQNPIGLIVRKGHTITIEHLTETVQKHRYHFVDAHASFQFLRQTGHTFVTDAARHNVFEPVEIRVAIEGQAVGGDEPAAVHPNSANLQVMVEKLPDLLVIFYVYVLATLTY